MTNRGSPFPAWREDALDHFGQALFYSPAFVLILHFSGLAEHNPGELLASRWGYAAAHAASASMVAWRVSRWPEQTDWLRTVAWCAYGAPACLLLLIPHTWFTTPPLEAFTLPAVMVWCVFTLIQAVRLKARRRLSLRGRAIFMAGAAASCGLVALPAFGIAGLGFLMGVWDPIPIAWLLTPLLIGAFTPLAIASAIVSGKLATEALRNWRGEPHHPPASLGAVVEPQDVSGGPEAGGGPRPAPALDGKTS